MFMELCEFYMRAGHQGTVDMRMASSSLLIHMFHGPTGPHLQNTKLKNKTIKKLRRRQQSTSIGPFCVADPVQLHRWDVHEADPAWASCYCATKK